MNGNEIEEFKNSLRVAEELLPRPVSNEDQLLYMSMGRLLITASVLGEYCLHEHHGVLRLTHDTAVKDPPVRAVTIQHETVLDTRGIGPNLSDSEKIIFATTLLKEFSYSRPKFSVVGAMKGVRISTVKI